LFLTEDLKMLDYLSSAITYPVDSLSAFFGAGWVIMAILSAMLIAAYIVVRQNNRWDGLAFMAIVSAIFIMNITSVWGAEHSLTGTILIALGETVWNIFLYFFWGIVSLFVLWTHDAYTGKTMPEPTSKDGVRRIATYFFVWPIHLFERTFGKLLTLIPSWWAKLMKVIARIPNMLPIIRQFYVSAWNALRKLGSHAWQLILQIPKLFTWFPRTLNWLVSSIAPWLAWAFRGPLNQISRLGQKNHTEQP
jgi:hypothetical protein